MGDKAELPTQVLGDDYFYEKETQDMNHEEDPFGNPAEDFQETQLLDEYDDSGGRSTPSCYKCDCSSPFLFGQFCEKLLVAFTTTYLWSLDW